MKLLVLGGTSFVGRHLVLSAQAAGMDITLFNRGRTNPGIFSDCEHITGDRETDLEALEGRRWDAVLDVNGYIPRIVGAAVETLADACGHYTYVSTISVYGDVGTEAPNEDSPVDTLKTETEDITPETYGPLKAGCEAFVRGRLGDRALIVRPGIVAGAYDPTERFVRWIRRAADGGEMLAPGAPDRPMQYIDARDHADWIISMILRRASGTYNVVRHPAITMGELLDTCVRVTAAGTRLEWVPEEFLASEEVDLFSDLPFLAPLEENGIFQTDASRAVGHGLTFRSLEDTVRATLAWDAARDNRKPNAGMTLEREREILAAWKAQRPAS